MCRDILNTCVRNTEDAEKAAMSGGSGNPAPGKKTAVWGMIEESELAKTIRGGFDKVRYRKVETQRSLTPVPSPHLQSRKKIYSSRRSARYYPIWKTLHFVHRWDPLKKTSLAVMMLRSREGPMAYSLNYNY